MALLLNTSHPLYSVLVALICVDDDNSIKDLKGDTCTPHANVTKGTGTYGRHFTTLLDGSGNAQGVALTTGFRTKEAAPAVGTTLIVVNNVNSKNNRSCAFDTKAAGAPQSPALSAANNNIISYGDETSCEGTSVILANGAHSFGCAFNATTQNKTFVDGTVQATGAGIGNYPARAKYIGGNPSGGFGGLACDYVWVAQFNKFLSDAEIADLHASLGASNAFGLVVSSGGSHLITSANSQQVNTASPGTISQAAISHAVTIASSQQVNTTLAGVISSPIGTDAYIDIPAIRDWETTNLKTGLSGVQVDIRNISTGALIVRKAGQATHATTAVCRVTDPAMPHATLCEVMVRFADGSKGVWDLMSV